MNIPANISRPILRTLARLLAPWRTIRRLEKEILLLHQALGESAVGLRQEAEYLRGDLAVAREAVRRLVRWNLEAYDSEVTRGVYLWATLNGMAGPLPPLPEWLAKRAQQQGDQKACC